MKEVKYMKGINKNILRKIRKLAGVPDKPPIREFERRRRGHRAPHKNHKGKCPVIRWEDIDTDVLDRYIMFEILERLL